MNKTSRIVFFIALVAALLLATGCNLKASTAPSAKATATSELNFLTPTVGGEGLKGQIMTQTAQAGAPGVATATPAPASPAAAAATAAPAAAAAGASSGSSSGSSSPAREIPTLARPTTYTLQKGEWPICIARRYNLDVAGLLAANGLDLSSKPGAGTVLKVPSSGTWNSGARTLHTHADYTVKSGDTVYTIACYFGDVSPEGILAANGLNNASDVTSGMTLKIP